MSATAAIRRRAGQRISSALWGLLVTGVGGLLIASYSGYEIDLELAAIIVLAAIGGWLLVSAAVSGIGRQREISRATAPTVEERVEPVRPAESASGPDVDETSSLDVAPTTELPHDDSRRT
ncbi:hypothetical protein [Demequina aestuarii]|uniref:hypothetical protein n=1 Tax=Demequina aestuarii TaxID=327095 RepID=UPI0007804614|nr:hypothetical protein [Demequina aestuarii]